MINRFSNPVFDGFDGGYYMSPYERYRRQQVYEEELRRRRLAELAYQRQMEEEERAHAREMARREYERELAARREAEQEYKIVRGMDGMLYRVPVKKAAAPKPQRKVNNNGKVQIVRGPDGRLYRILQQQPESDDEVSTTSSSKGADNMKTTLPEDNESVDAEPDTDVLKSNKVETTRTVHRDGPVEIKVVRKDSKKDERRTKGGQRKKVTVLVEDASDSENEDEMMSSVWRHRVPSPEESWMEPVIDMVKE